MLKVAVPNKGSLSESATLMLKEAGYRQRNDPRDLVLIDPENEIEFYYLRPRDPSPQQIRHSQTSQRLQLVDALQFYNAVPRLATPGYPRPRLALRGPNQLHHLRFHADIHRRLPHTPEAPPNDQYRVLLEIRVGSHNQQPTNMAPHILRLCQFDNHGLLPRPHRTKPHSHHR